MLEYSRLEGDHIREDDKTVSKDKGAQGAEFSSTTDESHLPFDLLELIMLEFCVGLEYINFRTTCKRCHLAAPIIKWSNQTESKRPIPGDMSPGKVVLPAQQAIRRFPGDLIKLDYMSCDTMRSQGKELTAVAPSESKAANKVSDAKSVYKNQNYRNLKETALPEPKQPAFFTEVSCPELETPPSALLISASVTALPEPNLQTL
ncbi:hypothetical protein Tco_1014728 [Tanacetum coccineum]